MSLPELTRTSSRQGHNQAAAPLERNIFIVSAGAERLALPVECVNTIFRISRITPVPGGPREVVGLANLRGKIVTVVSLRRRLGMAHELDPGPALAIGIEHLGESIALLVDEVGDVVSVAESDRIPAPPHLAATRLGVTSAVYGFERGILSVLDMAALFRFSGANAAPSPLHSPAAPVSPRQGAQK